jgi:hypothetical protein
VSTRFILFTLVLVFFFCQKFNKKKSTTFFVCERKKKSKKEKEKNICFQKKRQTRKKKRTKVSIMPLLEELLEQYASALDCLAYEASLSSRRRKERQFVSQLVARRSTNEETLRCATGPGGASVSLSMREPIIDLSKLFSLQCRNRECDHIGGQESKPRSIYCSRRCQSREQNLRQGRIKKSRASAPIGSATRQRMDALEQKKRNQRLASLPSDRPMTQQQRIDIANRHNSSQQSPPTSPRSSPASPQHQALSTSSSISVSALLATAEQEFELEQQHQSMFDDARPFTFGGVQQQVFSQN